MGRQTEASDTRHATTARETAESALPRLQLRARVLHLDCFNFPKTLFPAALCYQKPRMILELCSTR